MSATNHHCRVTRALELVPSSSSDIWLCPAQGQGTALGQGCGGTPANPSPAVPDPCQPQLCCPRALPAPALLSQSPASPNPAVPSPQLTMGIRPLFRVARRRRLMRWKHSWGV